jgi:hypothetical protein
MPQVLVQLLDVEANERLADHLVARGIGVKCDDGASIDPATMAACFQLGAAVAQFLHADGGTHKVHLDGPGAETTIYRFKAGEDIADSISRLIATCAGFQ